MQINGNKVVYAGRVAERLDEIKPYVKSIVELVEDCKEYFHDGVDEDIIEITTSIMKQINNLKRDMYEEDEL